MSDVKARYGDLADDYLRLYPPRDLEQTQLAATRDVVFGWASERLVRKQAAIGQDSFFITSTTIIRARQPLT